MRDTVCALEITLFSEIAVQPCVIVCLVILGGIHMRAEFFRQYYNFINQRIQGVYKIMFYERADPLLNQEI